MNSNVNRRKSRGIALLILGVVLLGIGLMAFIGVQSDLKKYETEGTRDFNQLTEAELSGKPYVEGRVEFVFEVFAEEYTTNYGIRLSDDSDKLYYLIPLVTEEGYIDYFVTLEATGRYYDTLNQIYEETWDESLPAVYTELYLEDAKIRSLPSSIEKILYDWCETGEFYQNGSFVDWCVESDFFGTTDSAEIVSHVLPYMIVPDSKPGGSALIGLVMAGIGLALLVVAVVLLNKAKNAPTVPNEAFASEAPAEEFSTPEAAPANAAPSRTNFCPQCGAPLEPGAKFCPSCGAKMEGMHR
ncbi:MAG: hypothetical protein DBX63_01920 [Clostridia bacterium]|jgi:hypothetical protein|nr:MAG: hypothetical protein DBX63_01920 [Clostridia bacterium]